MRKSTRNPNRYELRRYWDGRRDPDLRSAYSDAMWAIDVAFEYEQAGAMIEVWDSVEKRIVFRTSVVN